MTKSTAPILIFDRSGQRQTELAQDIRAASAGWVRNGDFYCYTPNVIFTQQIEASAQAAFFDLSDMEDAEAARKFNSLHSDIPLVVVSDNEEYGALSWQLGACYYLMRPITPKNLRQALWKCGHLSKHHRSSKQMEFGVFKARV
jgi:Response regulator containing CheY-like receiver and SARP domains